MKRIIIILFMLLLIISLAADTQLVDFNHTSNLDTYFDLAGATDVVNVSSNGIGNTGSIDIPSIIMGNTRLMTYKTGFRINQLDVPITVSAYFYNFQHGGYAAIGFSSAASNTCGSQCHITNVPAIGMAFHSGGDNFFNNTSSDSSSSSDIPLNSWYKLSFLISPRAGNSYDIGYKLHRTDSNGTILSLAKSRTIAFTNETFADDLIYPYFGIDGMRVTYVDDFSFSSPDFTLPVTLLSFTAITTNNSSSNIQWATASESNLLGYNIYRGGNEDINSAMRLNPTYIQASNSSTGSHYSYTDAEVEINSTYYYWLESAEFNGSVEFFGPVSLITGGHSEDIDVIEPVVPMSELKGNYPNPFNPTTTFDFYVQDGETANFTIFNLKGQILNSNLFESGEQRYVWNGRDKSGKRVSSGVYFYKLETESYESVRKMIISK